ncbi:hybrid sensor histidine kinase/response regulator transcription factor [Rubrivirga marina]|uniref:hybrid sensor histidine kinase/response regulator transcription factor n=1 Tax=Rubrivirga marina TaxID=1196024 RepID=UPI00117A2C8F|nr:hybrid sensor histidine kinase/response regulator transcription factor [Rubrivirga marina]
MALAAGCQAPRSDAPRLPRAAEPEAEASVDPAAPPDVGRTDPSVRFRHLTIDDGLAQGTVRTVMQDREGFLWLSTQGGLHRYDGHAVVVYKTTPFDTTSISDSWVNATVEAADGDLWVTTQRGGLNRMDRTAGTFVHYRHDPDDPASLSSDKTVDALVDRRGDLWVSTLDGGLNRMRAGEDGRFTRFRHDPDDPQSLPSDELYRLSEAPDGRIWAGSANGVLRLDPATGAVTRFLFVPESAGGLATPFYVYAMYHPPGTSGIVWLATGNGLVRLDSETGAFQRYVLVPNEGAPNSRNTLRSVIPDPEAPGVLWVSGMGTGIARFDVRAEAFTRYRHDPVDAYSLAENSVFTVASDRSGTMWVGYASQGVSAFNTGSAYLSHLRHDPRDDQSLAPGIVWGIYEDREGTLWVNTDVGELEFYLTRVDAGGRVVRYRHDPTDPTALYPGVNRSFAEDPDGRLWIAEERGVSRFDRATGRVTRFLQPERSPADRRRNDVYALLPTAADGHVFWVGSVGGLDRFDTRTGQFSRVPLRLGAAGEAPNVEVLHESPDGTLWAGTTDGLVRLAPSSVAEIASAYDSSDPTTISSNLILDIAERPEEPGVLWLATRGGGLNRYDARAGTARLFTTDDGLPSDVVYGLLQDERGVLWMSTDHGIAAFDPTTETFRRYGLGDGLIALEYNTHGFTMGRDGVLHFGSGMGVTSFRPERLQINRIPPQVALTGLRVFNEPVGGPSSPLRRSLSETETIRLAHDQNQVTFEFAALHFKEPDANRYAYRLEGLDERWIDGGAQPSATYTNVPPGRYTFRVRAANSDGVWNEEGASVGLVVAPPWWRTWWAYAGYLALGLGGAMLAVRDRRRRVALRHRLELEHVEAQTLRELDRAKSRFFANVSHEFRTPLTLTLGPLDDVLAGEYGPVPDEVADPLGLARRSAHRVLDLINQILDVARLEAGSAPLRARRLDLRAFVEAQVEAFTPLATHRRVAVDVATPEAPVPVWADPAHLGTVLANLLSNAFKFTPAGGTVRVVLEVDGGAARVTVRDTGPGIAEADLPHVFDRFYQADGGGGQPLGSGIGLALAHELAALHGGTLTVESAVGEGSAFTLSLLLGRDHLTPEQVDDQPWEGGAVVPVPEPDVEPDPAPLAHSDDEDVTTVLVADDQPEIRAFVRRHLEGAGYRVVEAADGEEALDRARQRLPDLVVSDVMMPRLDGLGLCRALRSDPETDFVPILLLTARAAPQDRLDGLAELCDDYLTKPFDVRELVARADNLIALRRRLRDRFEGASGDGVAGDGAAGGPPPIESAEDAFVASVREAIEARLSDETFSVSALAEAVGLSRSHLLRRTTELMGTTPSDLLRTARLDRAADLLAARAGTVSEVAYGVGFKSVAHFSNAFLDHTGSRPSAYAEATR